MVCGRHWPVPFFVDECDMSQWSDPVLRPLKILKCLIAFCDGLSGVSLILQFTYPMRGVGLYGNEQLFYRGVLRMVDTPLQFLAGVCELGAIGKGRGRTPLVPFGNFLKGFCYRPIVAWSLLNQWATSGAGKKLSLVKL